MAGVTEVKNAVSQAPLAIIRDTDYVIIIISHYNLCQNAFGAIGV
jgi:hypothetical protein